MFADPKSNPCPEDLARAELERIRQSSVFHRSERLQKLLEYLVEAVLQHLDGSALTEYSIGRQVFGKPEPFDPRKDTVVRVEAHRLRAKLAEYFATEGRNDPVEISLAPRSYVPAICDRSEAAPAANGGRCLVVMPCLNLDPDKLTERFVRGFSTELLDALARLEGVHVLCGRRRGSANLGDLLLETSVRKQNRILRTAVQLLGAADGALLWSHVYEHGSNDPSAEVQTARAVAQALSNVLGLDWNRNSAQPPVSQGVELLYLKGCHLRDGWTREGLLKAVRWFEQAASEDPNYALPHAGLAEVYTLLALHGECPAAETMPKARAAAMRALGIAPALPDTHTTLGVVAAFGEWDFARAEREFQRALGIAPDNAAAAHWYACCCLLPAGRLEQAVATLRHAVEAAPLSFVPNISLGWALHFSGRSEEAAEQLRQTLELEPHRSLAHWSLGLVYEALSLGPEAIAALERARELSPNVSFILSALGHAYGVFGMSWKAVAVLDELLETGKIRYVPALDVALVYLGLGETAKAFDWVEKALTERCPWLTWLPVDPRARPLRSEPQRFESLLRRIGLPLPAGFRTSSKRTGKPRPAKP